MEIIINRQSQNHPLSSVSRTIRTTNSRPFCGDENYLIIKVTLIIVIEKTIILKYEVRKSHTQKYLDSFHYLPLFLLFFYVIAVNFDFGCCLIFGTVNLKVLRGIAGPVAADERCGKTFLQSLHNLIDLFPRIVRRVLQHYGMLLSREHFSLGSSHVYSNQIKNLMIKQFKKKQVSASKQLTLFCSCQWMLSTIGRSF